MTRLLLAAHDLAYLPISIGNESVDISGNPAEYPRRRLVIQDGNISLTAHAQPAVSEKSGHVLCIHNWAHLSAPK